MQFEWPFQPEGSMTDITEMSDTTVNTSVDSEKLHNQRRKKIIVKRPLHFWKPFNTWWREKLSTSGSRPTSHDIACWYRQNCSVVWQHDPPTIQETRSHAKCMRTVADVRKYFREYRARQKDSCNMKLHSSDKISKSSSCSGMSDDATDEEIDPDLLALFESQHATSSMPTAAAAAPGRVLPTCDDVCRLQHSTDRPGLHSLLPTSLSHLVQPNTAYHHATGSIDTPGLLTSVLQERGFQPTAEQMLGIQASGSLLNLTRSLPGTAESAYLAGDVNSLLATAGFSRGLPEKMLASGCKPDPEHQTFALHTGLPLEMPAMSSSNCVHQTSNPTPFTPQQAMQSSGSSHGSFVPACQDFLNMPPTNNSALSSGKLQQESCMLMAQAMACDYQRVLMSQMHSQQLMIQGAIAEIGRYLAKQ